MNPNDDTTPQPDNRGQITPPTRDYAGSHQAAAQMTRQQIDQLYQEQHADVPAQQTVAANDSAYGRTHTDASSVNPDEWQQYHSAWQDYYQKYYGHYYASAYHEAHKTLQDHAVSLQQQSQQAVADEPLEEETLGRKEAVQELRSQLLGKVQDNAKKVRKSRHFVPLISGFAVLFIFVFLQYNSNIIAIAKAYTSPGNIDPQNIILDPSASLEVDSAPKLIIPKINVDVPVDYTATPDYDSQIEAMRTSVAYFGIPGANSKPGQLGNVPIAGHSSNDFTAPGNGEIKFIFAQLEKLQKGDLFYLNYESTRYTYAITEMLVVQPNEVNKIQLGDDKPYATLITCTPLGTAQKRLLVVAEQISPSPSGSTDAPEVNGEPKESTELTGKSPTLLERAFGAR